MIYNETFLKTVTDVHDLVVLLRDAVPMNATIEMATNYDHLPMVEVWYDKDTNTVILK